MSILKMLAIFVAFLGLSVQQAAAICDPGDLAIAQANRVVVVPPVPSMTQRIIAVTSGLTGVAFAGGTIYAYGNGNVYEIDCVAQTSSLVASGPAIGGSIGADPATGMLYLGASDGIYRFNPSDNSFTQVYVADVGEDVRDVAVDADSCLVFATAFTGAGVYRAPNPGSTCPLVSKASLSSGNFIGLDVHRLSGTVYIADDPFRSVSLTGGGSFHPGNPDDISNANVAVTQGPTPVVYVSGDGFEGAGVYQINTLTGAATVVNTDGALATSGDIAILGVIGGGSCGNGEVELGEQCDEPGNPCCVACQFAPAQTECSDGLFCTDVDMCDGAGVCQSGGPVDCNDENVCTLEQCEEESFGCVSADVPEGVECDDGNACTSGSECNGLGQCEVHNEVVTCPLTDGCQVALCNPGTGTCSDGSFGPVSEATQGVKLLKAGTSNILLNNVTRDASDQVKWTATKGGELNFTDLVNLTSTGRVGVCIWDDNGDRTLYNQVLEGATADCGNGVPGSCWSALPKSKPLGYRFLDKNKAPGVSRGGARLLHLKTTKAGVLQQLQYQAKGVHVPESAFAPASATEQVSLPVVAQACFEPGVGKGNVVCIQSRFTGTPPDGKVTVNDPVRGQVKATEKVALP